MSFDFFFSLFDDILQLSLQIIVRRRYLYKPKLIIFSLIKPCLYLVSQFLSGLFNQISQSFNLKSMVGIAVLQLISQTLEISFIQSRYLDFGELDFPFIMFNNLLNFMFELEIVLLDQLQSVLFTSLQLFVDFQNTSDFFLLCSNDCP